MKITIIDGKVVAVAESISDIQVLIPLGTAVEPRKKHKKHQYKYECPTCKAHYKGKRGLGIHRAKAHNTPAL